MRNAVMFNHRFHLRRAAAACAFMAASAAAFAAEAGRIVFVSGSVQLGRQAAALNDAVNEGDEITTGRDGYVYVKTVDDGLLVLRPASRARIDAYHVDAQNPANTRVKLELLDGVARTVSGKGVKAARQNFRFNTPVAAIGVRGTDFTVATDQETSTVTVLSGAVVVSGFGGSCQPGGAGPCEHFASRELSASHGGQMLQVRRGQPEPRLLPSGAAAPDVVAPPRADEPGKSTASTGTSAEPSLDAQKANAVLQQGLAVRPATVPPAVTDQVTPPVVEQPQPPAPELPPAPPPPPPSTLVWGRWAAIAGGTVTIDPAAVAAAGGKVVATNPYYSIYKTQGSDIEVPQSGTAGFYLSRGEALVSNAATKLIANASLDNGKLNVDFGAKTFTTAFDLTTGNEKFSLGATGNLSANGAMSATNQFIPGRNMSVNGALGSQGDAAYIFSARIDAQRTANGVTYWIK
jgi:hypothetical protein